MIATERLSNILFGSRDRAMRLQRNLRLLCHLECANPGSEIKDIQYVKSQLNELAVERYRGAVVRSRAERCFRAKCRQIAGLRGKRNKGGCLPTT